MQRLLRTLAPLLFLLVSCTGGDSREGGVCEAGDIISDACTDSGQELCEPMSCVEGQWQCREGLFETYGCPQPKPDANEGACTKEQEPEYSCAAVDSPTCESANCVDGQWLCPEGMLPVAEPCVSPDRDCSDLGGGEAVLAERCLGDVVEYCIYSDTTQTATWTEIQSCAAPQSCQKLDEQACCTSDENSCSD